jgi:hypothetical protein
MNFRMLENPYRRRFLILGVRGVHGLQSLTQTRIIFHQFLNECGLKASWVGRLCLRAMLLIQRDDIFFELRDFATAD